MFRFVMIINEKSGKIAFKRNYLEQINILRIRIGGFANIESVQLELNKLNALVGLNNYGKSNVIAGISFAFSFLRFPAEVKTMLMAERQNIPINKAIDDIPFSFEISYEGFIDGEIFNVVYGYSFKWIRNNKSRGQKVVKEYLNVKGNSGKYKAYLNRDLNEAFYLPSPTGRCDKKLQIKENELAINKLRNFDELFYSGIIESINILYIRGINTLSNPDTLLIGMRPKIVRNDYSLELPIADDTNFFIYSLKKKDKNWYKIFEDSIKSLLPSIEFFRPVEVNIKDEVLSRKESGKLPLDFPERMYNITVKEYNNNQSSVASALSSGSKKIIYMIAMVIAAEINNIPLLTFEEIENSIHPGLLQKLLLILDGIAENTKILVTSHSPHLVQYLNANQIMIGLPNSQGLAVFRQIKETKFKKLVKMAQEEGVSTGDLIFDKMIEFSNGDSKLLNDLCE